MMKNILVPIGSHKNTAATLQYAIDFVEGTGAKLYIIKVYGVSKAASSMKNIDQVLVKDSDKELQEVLSQVNKKNVEIISKSVKGNIADSIQRVAKQLAIDLVISTSKCISKDKKVFLGRVAGSLIKDTDIPVLVIPKKYEFKKVSKILLAVKSGRISSPDVISPLKNIVSRFNSHLDMIRVITPSSTEAEAELSEDIKALTHSFKTTENATIFQGVLEHIHIFEPEMLCVIRRKRGFFSRLWEHDRVYKKDFESRVPLLILKGAL